jgi:hypothetical protein
MNVASPTKPSTSPIINGFHEQFTTEFMQLYDNDYTKTKTNSFSSLSVSNDMTLWLNDIDQFQAVTNGKTQNNVLKRWDQPWENLEQASPGYTVHKEEDSSTLIHGRHPKFMLVTADTAAPSGSYIGEINGQIGRISDYKEDSSNKWDYLLHPEPFVYFHVDLPIYIDSRNEGSDLRFVRRSCQPNSKVEIIIVGQLYHFCLVSEKDIDAADEITIPWTFEERFFALIKPITEKKTLKPDDATHIKRYLSNLKANFGGCACKPSPSGCLLEKMLTIANKELYSQPPKPIRKKGGKKMLNQISPLSTGRATNSRAGSEAVNQMDIDEEALESRSVSGSARSKPSSRDNTPATAEPSVGLGVELSSREQRKLLQSERLFEKMENDRGRKRNSAGSALNTPTITTSVSLLVHAQTALLNSHKKRLGHDNPTDPSPTSIINATRRISLKSTRRSMPNGVRSHPRKSKPVYLDMATQTDATQDEVVTNEDITDWRRSHGCTYASRLLKRSRMSRPLPESRSSPLPNGTTSQVVSSSGTIATQTPTLSRRDMPPPPPPTHQRKQRTVSPISFRKESSEPKDVEMKDVDEPQTPVLSNGTEVKKESPTIAVHEPRPSRLQLHPITVRTEIEESEGVQKQPEESSTSDQPKSADVSPNSQFQSPQSVGPDSPELNTWPRPGTATTPKIDLSKIQNPYATGNMPLMSPALMSPALASPMAQPSPVKKKLSLSDWTNRNKKKAQEAAAAHQSTPKTITEESSDMVEKENKPDGPSQLVSPADQPLTSDPIQNDSQPSVSMDIDQPSTQNDA